MCNEFDTAETLAREFAIQNNITDAQTIARLAGLLHGIVATYMEEQEHREFMASHPEHADVQ